MISKRLKEFRLARGYSLDELAERIDNIVSKQSLSKYEQGKVQPAQRILVKIAAALNIKTMDLLRPAAVEVSFIAYRRRASLAKREQEKIQQFVADALEARIRLQELTGSGLKINLPIGGMAVAGPADAETAASQLREKWSLGNAPIANLTKTLEDHHIHVFMIAADEKFDGLSAVAGAPGKAPRAAAIISRSDLPGDRQRLNLAHELGHLVLKIDDNYNEEKAAFRFGAAFLAPAEVLFQQVGSKRKNIQTNELLLLKQQFGMSVQALLYRLHELEIINKTAYQQWCININKLGWKKKEPLSLPPEKPQWLLQSTLRALSEGVISRNEAQRLLPEKDRRLIENVNREFLQKSLPERRRLLSQQADLLARHYPPEAPANKTGERNPH